MSLLKSFPEIDKFFASSKFTDTDLNSFLQQIEKNYGEKDLRKAALNLITLELAKFNIEQYQVDLKPLRKRSLHNDVKPQPLDEIQELKKLTVEMIAEKLRWRVERVITFLLQKGIEKSATESLGGDEFNNVKEMFIARLKAVQRMDKKQLLEERGTIKNKKFEKSLSPRNDVYSKIQELGLGKVIYIRKR